MSEHWPRGKNVYVKVKKTMIIRDPNINIFFIKRFAELNAMYYFKSLLLFCFYLAMDLKQCTSKGSIFAIKRVPLFLLLFTLNQYG